MLEIEDVVVPAKRVAGRNVCRMEPEIEGHETEIGRFAVQTTLTPVPEPATVLLLGAGVAGWLTRWRRKHR